MMQDIIIVVGPCKRHLRYSIRTQRNTFMPPYLVI